MKNGTGGLNLFPGRPRNADARSLFSGGMERSPPPGYRAGFGGGAGFWPLMDLNGLRGGPLQVAEEGTDILKCLLILLEHVLCIWQRRKNKFLQVLLISHP